MNICANWYSIKITEIHDMVKNLVDLYKHSSRSAIIGHELVEGGGGGGGGGS